MAGAGGCTYSSSEAGCQDSRFLGRNGLTRVRILAQLPTCGVTSGEGLKFSEPQLSHLQNRRLGKWGGEYTESGFPSPSPPRISKGHGALALQLGCSGPPARPAGPELAVQDPEVRASLPTLDLHTHAASRGLRARSVSTLGAAILARLLPGHGPPGRQQIENAGLERSRPKWRSTNRKAERPWSCLIPSQVPPPLRPGKE